MDSTINHKSGAILGAIAGKPTDECSQQLITTQQIFKLLATVAHQPLPYLSATESSPFYGIVVNCLSVVGQHAAQPPLSVRRTPRFLRFSRTSGHFANTGSGQTRKKIAEKQRRFPQEGEGEERPKVVTALITLLSKLTTKCFVDFGEADDGSDAANAGDAVMDAVFTCLGFVLPLVSIELLTGTQKLHHAFFELVPFLVENFPVGTLLHKQSQASTSNRKQSQATTSALLHRSGLSSHAIDMVRAAGLQLRVAALPAGIFTTIMQSLGYGLSSAAHIGGATTTARSCLTAIGAMAAESLRYVHRVVSLALLRCAGHADAPCTDRHIRRHRHRYPWLCPCLGPAVCSTRLVLSDPHVVSRFRLVF